MNLQPAIDVLKDRKAEIERQIKILQQRNLFPSPDKYHCDEYDSIEAAVKILEANNGK